MAVRPCFPLWGCGPCGSKWPKADRGGLRQQKSEHGKRFGESAACANSPNLLYCFIPCPAGRGKPLPYGAEATSSAIRLAGGDRRMPPPPCGARKTLRACAESTLPQCHSRACFATARQWRGCGNCWLPSSATGSGSQQFLVFSDRSGKSALPSTAAGSGSTLFSSSRRLRPAIWRLRHARPCGWSKTRASVGTAIGRPPSNHRNDCGAIRVSRPARRRYLPRSWPPSNAASGLVQRRKFLQGLPDG